MNSDKFSEASEVQAIIDAYNFLVNGINEKAISEKERAYGGIIRSGKGKLVESLTEHLVQIAWSDLGGKEDRLSFLHSAFEFPIKKEYVERLKNEEVKEYILANIKDYHYRFKPDVQVAVDGKFVMGIECKAYTENAMFKRILVDFTLLKIKFPQLDCVLLQLESQLGGDYSALGDVTYGSPSTHTLLSYFDVNLNIITLLVGERKVDRPIHKQEFFKPLTQEALYKAIVIFKDLLKNKK